MPVPKIATLNWPLPGVADAFVFFKSTRQFVGLQVLLMPGYVIGAKRIAFYGDSISSDDFINIDHFEQELPKLSKKHQFVRVVCTNISPAEVEFDLVFRFAATDTPNQSYPYKVAAGATIFDQIPVVLTP